MNIIAYTVADDANKKHADKLIRSFHKFHPDIEVRLYGANEVGKKENYYRQKAMFARGLIKDYDLVIGLDADMIITGKLDYMFTEPYDVGTVLNFNKVDKEMYGDISVLDIPPQMYVNAGLVAVRSKAFVEHWWTLCNSYHFNNLRYREQDILNIMVHYGDYEVECFDLPNDTQNYHAWHGLVAKGEYLNMIVKDNKLILPVGKDGFPDHEKEIKVLHSAGGGNEPKVGDAYRIQFNEDVIKYIDGLLK